MTFPPPALEHVCDLSVTIDAPVEVGLTTFGLRRMIPITGGTVKGPLFNGRIVPGGARLGADAPWALRGGRGLLHPGPAWHELGRGRCTGPHGQQWAMT